MNNFPVKVDNETYWISRSIAVVGVIFCLDDGLRVLIGKRGKGCPDYQGYWNCPCGYLDYNETLRQACSREINEETNLNVNPSFLRLYAINDSPTENKQNVSFTYWAFSKHFFKGQTIYPKGFESFEVEDVEWISIDDLDEYQFAFNHKTIIAKIALEKLSEWISKSTQEKLFKFLQN